MKKVIEPSEFINLKGIEYFNFEEDFIEDNVRCIPMVVRFKMDAVGIKLKLAEWSKFSADERVELAIMPISNSAALNNYHGYLVTLIKKYTNNEATIIAVDTAPVWRELDQIQPILTEKLQELNLKISLIQWRDLSDMQRFVLLKLCRPGHENKNFPKAMVEFGLS
ncbi:nitrate reductase associated protein [Pedobacter frigiditerrae]|uniref:Nitrate reductase associated protein n=1 Tax=Pedobacter frigiditerrae TaxID=2530452 RepID=A0A4R0MKT9_9SPHI|nr:nitrate reductase associated protein [Pedobacter frigiditerrae]TCC87279.1 nitrate reductase associated protein [Pedobacter frigiditerrae]